MSQMTPLASRSAKAAETCARLLLALCLVRAVMFHAGEAALDSHERQTARERDALNARLNLPSGAGLRETWTAIARHVVGIGRLTSYANP